jgi:glycosyltransferase involved in cell wall biosynthesis
LTQGIRFARGRLLDAISALIHVGETRNRARTLEQRLDTETQANRDLQRQVAQLATLVQTQQQRLDAATQANRDLQQSLAQLATLTQSQQQQLDAATQSRQTLQQQLAAATQTLEDLRQTIGSAARSAALEGYYRDLVFQRQLDPLRIDLAQRHAPVPAQRPPPARPRFTDAQAPALPAHPDNHHLAIHPYTLLHVGRFSPDQAQHRLIDTLYALGQLGEDNLQLILASPPQPGDDPVYLDCLREHAVRLGLAGQVRIHPAQSDRELEDAYHAADLYLSLADAPQDPVALQRALAHDRLVLAHAVNDWLPHRARLTALAPDSVAAAIRARLRDARARRAQLADQRACWQGGDSPAQVILPSTKRGRDEEATPGVGLDPISAPPLNIRIEGPYDSTYSLALVNSALALALRQQGDRVTLHSTDGFGDNPPTPAFLAANPRLDAIRRRHLPRVDVTLRNLYPPRTNAMPGVDKLIGPYGWEESAFPAQWMQGFNRRLTGVLCMSDDVRDTLIANGLRVPAITTGIVADAIFHHPPQDPGFALPGGYRLLHISSGFPRKGLDILLQVFLRLPADISLIIKTFPNPHNDIRQRLGDLGFHATPASPGHAIVRWTKDARRLLLIDADLPPGQIVWLYRHADQLVAPSRGEGFGLPMAEAMLFGVPVVTTDHGGQRDFCTPDTAWLIASRPVPARTHFALTGSQWAEPDPASLRQAILDIRHASPATRRARTDPARALIQSRYSARAVATRIHQALSDLAHS